MSGVTSRGVTGRGADAPTVLVVDDEPSVLQLLSFIFRENRVSVLTAADGDEGLECFRANCDDITLVFLDVTMPRLDGFDTAAALHELKPELPIVMMSGYHEGDVTSRFAGAHKIDFLHKPFRVSDVLAAFNRVLERLNSAP